jgi:hypothetical protein
VNRYNGAAATKFIVGGAKVCCAQAQEGECASAHDTWLNRHVQFTPAESSRMVVGTWATQQVGAATQA